MKAWTDLSSVPMPSRIANLPRDPRGYPIPVNVLQKADGFVDFRVIDPEKLQAFAAARCCSVCGHPMGTRVAFVGGPLCIENHLFADAGMHRDCATYALRVCPFIAAPSFGFRKTHDPKTMEVMDFVSTDRPEKFGLVICKDYRPALLNGQSYVLQVGQYESLEWWAKGSPVEQ